MKTIAICSSGAFYKHVNDVAEELEGLGFDAVVPSTANEMKRTGDYDISKRKTWYENSDDFNKKTEYIDLHIKEVENADAILVVNDEKRGVKGYIGGNVMVEMAIAYYLKKPIFVLNPVNQDNPVYEEVLGLGSTIIDNDLSKISL